MERIDWIAQWRDFAPNFYNGRAHIDLAPHGMLLLEPGEGFGDLSHPTTRLMLELMKPLAAGQVVLDIGCGSGILTLASLLLGADRAHGIDIDKAALIHAKKNAKLNGLCSKLALLDKSSNFCTGLQQNFESLCEHRVEKFCCKDAKKGNFSKQMEFRKKANVQKTQFSKKAHPKVPYSLVLMNMIFSEQKVAFKKYPFQHLITSGILIQEKERYLKWATEMGWHLLYEKSEGEWLGFIFKPSVCK